jgi:hypothetical protein
MTLWKRTSARRWVQGWYEELPCLYKDIIDARNDIDGLVFAFVVTLCYTSVALGSIHECSVHNGH